MSKIQYVSTYKDLKKSKLLRDSLSEDDLVVIEDEQAAYRYKNGMFEKVDPDVDTNLNVSLYDMNKQIIAQSPSIQEHDAEKILQEYSGKHYANNYFMMLNHEKRYFTLFARNAAAVRSLATEILDCARSLGEIKTIETYDDRLEIWILIDDEVFDFLLFEYDQGVIDFEW